ncbi:MAG: molybdopterin cofactor-binding domain-containing protein [Pseudomonas sp.]|uniref:xanthine dehydrogenase family protein molybdopterin-binding subunit n=1 Tax=Pseudomonas sp. TaxID=306 RepID=UPI003BB6DB12
MATAGTLTRRAFLLGSVAVAGGVAFGVYQYRQPYPNPLGASVGASVLNPYLIIDQRGVTIITPRAEMGQGVHSTLAALVAEELDVRWEEVRAEHGPASPAYFNQAVIAGTAPFAAFDDSTAARFTRDALGVASKFLGVQITGGSSSIVDAFDKMRMAGAAARVVLIEAAARRWGVSASSLRTADGQVINPASGAQFSYSELAVEAASITPPTEPTLKDRSQWRYLGKSMPRLDMPAKCTGTAQFGIDVRLPDMLYATVRANPRLGGMLNSFDASEAKQAKGVKQVIDLGGAVAVVADNTWRAFQAAAKLKFDWGPAPYPASSEAIFTAIAAAFNGPVDDVPVDHGDAGQALASAPQIVSAEYQAPFLAHSTLEPMNAVAQLHNGQLEIWAGHQAPTIIRQQAAELAGLPIEQVQLHVQFLGGGFGRRLESDYILQAVKLAMALPGRPIKLTWSRSEDIQHDMYRPAAIARCQGVMGSAGVPLVVQMDIASPSVGRSFAARVGMPAVGPDRAITEGSAGQPYSIANYRVSGYDPSLQLPVGNWRSVGASFNSFFHESFLDELALAGGVDPLAMRLQMTADFPVAQQVLNTVAAMANWQQPLPAGRARGLALCLSFGTTVAQVIEVSQTDAGVRIDKVYCAADVGIALDPQNLEAQMSSAIIYGLSAAIMGEISFADGAVVQSNFHDYDALRMRQVPPIEVRILENGPTLSGAGEPGTPPSLPALANAIHALTGQRLRSLPLNKQVKFA